MKNEKQPKNSTQFAFPLVLKNMEPTNLYTLGQKLARIETGDRPATNQGNSIKAFLNPNRMLRSTANKKGKPNSTKQK
jgi:hypothetical protein